ncbi:MAG: DUF1800 domain-containing protein, partial [Alphaproteobacteria bacterium]|nr:DUF1800 domain-containing protein [Alphaproteobacteria bacterium]
SPRHAPPPDAAAMIAALAGPDKVAAELPIAGFDATHPSTVELRAIGRARTEAKGTPREPQSEEARRAMFDAARALQQRNALSAVARGVIAPDGLRERLTSFWADHFTVIARNGSQFHLVSPYIADAIRPHVAGSFADMVVAATTHPMMVQYLEQHRSLGPESPQGLRTGKGLNENLARELLELHLVGVNGGYTQADVTQMAELLTGLTYTPADGIIYRPGWAEPGAEVIMGRRYSAASDMSTITQALRDLAVRPETAAHIARKLAVHFVSDTPDPDLVATLTQRFLATQGDLLQVTAALLDHPAAWSPDRAKVRRPDLFLTAALRALGVSSDRIVGLDRRAYNTHVAGPLKLMGQQVERPIGPDGWSEKAATWITPQGLAGRISWALRSPQSFVEALPDPRDFVQTAVGPHAPPELTFAVGAAESDSDGIGLILTSPTFQRI